MKAHSRPYLSAARRRSHQRKRDDDRRGLFMIGAAVLAIVLCGALALIFRETPHDTRTGCLTDHRAPKAHTVILIDETDALSRDELAYAKALIQNEYFWLPVGGRLTVRNIVSDPDLAEDIVVCRMDDGSNVLGIGVNKKKVQQDFQQVAGARLEDLYTALRTAQPQDRSPIAESVARVFDRANFGPGVKQRRLVILSDMAQHSRLFTQYDGRLKPSDAALAESRRDMDGTEVRIQYVVRPKLARIQGEAHRRFWRSYFENMGAKVEIGHGLLIGEDQSKEIWSNEP